MAEPKFAQDEQEAIALIGMAGRFPGARDIAGFWRNLCQGKEAITFFDDEQLLAKGVKPEQLNDPNYVKASLVLEGIDQFDAAFFGFSPREAETLDPQQRIFLETAWHALEHAGYASEEAAGAVGVFAGVDFSGYLINNLLTSATFLKNPDSFQLLMSNDKDYIATRISYLLDLTGPSVDIQTACSTSLVAVHFACQSLLDFQCDLALAGGVSVKIPHGIGYRYKESGILSPDGRCRAFDAGARGTLSGNGSAAIVLKRLQDALDDRDPIYAVIKGSAVNNDGARKAGFTAPSEAGQVKAIQEALQIADVDPATVGFVEAHGTGTRLGDPIEVAALKKVFGTGAGGKTCFLGSLKTNVGHLGAAAGVTGLIKAALSLHHGRIPPSLHFERPNPLLGLEASPFTVNTELKEWPQQDRPRRAGVSSFGIGGTNAHAVLEEAPPPARSGEAGTWQLLTLSAKTDSALAASAAAMAEQLESEPNANLADMAFTLALGRKGFAHRRAVLGRDRADLLRAMRERDAARVFEGAGKGGVQIVFLFSGQGSQYPGMAAGLYRTEPVFRRAMDKCCELLRPHLDLNLRALIFPLEAEKEGAADTLRNTGYAQPALFAVSYALAELWQSWGITPAAMIGHSLGEYVAATRAGVFRLEDALLLVARRAKLMQDLPGGAMLSVSLPADRIEIPEGMALAAVNAPGSTVLSGSHEAIDALARGLETRGVRCQRLNTSHAFHSAMMEPVLETFTRELARVGRSKPRIPFISNLTGTWIGDSEATQPDYWARHLRETVRFSQGIATLLEQPDTLFLEVGPGTALRDLTRQHLSTPNARLTLASLPHPKDSEEERAFLLGSLGRLWCAGLNVDWAGFYAHQKRARLPLPGYPFERRRFWVDPSENLRQALAQLDAERRKALADWFYLPSWKRVLPPKPAAEEPPRRAVIFADRSGLAQTLADRMRAEGARVRTVTAGTAFRENGDGFEIDPARPDHYARLLTEAGPFDLAVHCWQFGAACPEGIDKFQSAQKLGFYSLLHLSGALADRAGHPLRLYVVTSGLHEDDSEFRPQATTLLGLCKVIPQELPQLQLSCIDFPSSEAVHPERTARKVWAELRAEQPAPRVDYRGGQRWVPHYEPVSLNPAETSVFREEGVYLITGGLGKIGLGLAKHLAEKVRARLALVTRTAMPPSADWDRLLADENTGEDLKRRIEGLQALDKRGAPYLLVTADVADETLMREALTRIESKFGKLHGIFHLAGLPGKENSRALEETEAVHAEAQFKPKVHGLYVLETLCRGRDLDFVVLFSSNAAVLGGLGHGAYASANQFMDAFAARQCRNGAAWLSCNWDGWSFGVEDASPRAAFRVTPEQGFECLERILGAGLRGQVTVSSQPLAPRLRRWIEREFLREAEAEPNAERHERPALQNPYEAPQDERERKLVEIWGELLGIREIGVRDNFFALGGHSLLAVQVIARCFQELGVKISLRDLFEAPTPAELAAVVATRDRADQNEIEPVEENEDYALAKPQESLWLSARLQEGTSALTISNAYRVEGDLDADAFRKALDSLIARHEILRTRFVTVEGVPRQKMVGREPFPLEFLDLSDRRNPEEAAREVVREMALRELDLERGPLLSGCLMQLGPRLHFFSLASHHLISDAWSVEILMKEFLALYRGFAAGEPHDLPPLPLQYKDYAAWLNHLLDEDEGARHRDYWLTKLAGELRPVEVPTDYPRPEVQGFKGATLTFLVSPETVAALRSQAERRNASLFMILVTALYALLYRYTGQEDLLVGTPSTSRVREILKNQVGYYLNLLVLRTGVSAEDRLIDLLAKVRETLLGAYEHQLYPFSSLVHDLRFARHAGRSSLTNIGISMNYANILGTPLPRIGELTFTPYKRRLETSKDDLCFLFQEGGDALSGLLIYDTDLFTLETATRFSDRYRGILEQMASDPETLIQDLALFEHGESREESDNESGEVSPVPAEETPLEISFNFD